MNTIFSTADVHLRDRFDYWHSVACKTIVSNDAEPFDKLSFAAKLAVGKIADIDLVSFENSPMWVRHTEKHARNLNSDDFLFCLQHAGSLLVEQGGREAQLMMGDMVLVDPARAYQARFQSNSKLLVFKVPRILLAPHTAPVSEFAALPIRSAPGAPGLISNILAALPQHAAKLDSSAHAIIQCQVLDLLRLALGQVSDRTHVSRARLLGLGRIKSAISARLPDPALNPARVAEAANVSIRYANSILAQEGTSLSRLIRDMRLARVKRILDEAPLVNVSIKEIASNWGFSDMTHFGRMFKREFGCSPREYRKRAPNRDN